MRRKGALRTRVLLWLSIMLLAFFAATIAALEWSLSASLSRARSEVLEAQLIALMSAAEANEGARTLSVPSLPDRRMATPESGLYGEIRTLDGELMWRSPSAVALAATDIDAAPPGVRQQGRVDDAVGGAERTQRSVTVTWEFDDGITEQFVFVISQSLEPYRAQQRGFRIGLVSWFAGLTLATLILLSLVLRRVLRPLATIESEIRDIETGRRERLSATQPTELAGVGRNLNALLARERGRQQRYRDSLANLAHSLKTPLAAMQTVIGSVGEPELRRALADGIARMDRIVAYQLKRASVIGDKLPGVRAVPVAPVVQDLHDSLVKVYRERNMDVTLDIDQTATFYGDEGDLQEILGNLMDNAWKYGRSRIMVKVTMRTQDETVHLEIRVEDDGPGVPTELASLATSRGMRLDENQPGHGIGLAVVRDIVETLDGELVIGHSLLGGAALVVTLPAPA